MTPETWLFFVVTDTALCLTPGPAVLFVVSSGLARGGREALWANGGILAGNTFYFLLSAVGVGAVIAASHEVFTVLKFGGAGYLVYLGVQTWRGAGLAVTAAPDVHPGRGWRMLARGFLVQAANAKALIFFAALLPQFIDPRGSLAWQVLILAVTSVSIEFVVLAAYGYGAGRAAALARERRFVTMTNRVSGGMLVAAGTAVAMSER